MVIIPVAANIPHSKADAWLSAIKQFVFDGSGIELFDIVTREYIEARRGRNVWSVVKEIRCTHPEARRYLE